MNEMIERVAKAMFEKDQQRPAIQSTNVIIFGRAGFVSWDELLRMESTIAPVVSKVWREHARHAIEEMREPTEAMLNVPPESQFLKWADAWRAMIDEALKP